MRTLTTFMVVTLAVMVLSGCTCMKKGASTEAGQPEAASAQTATK